MFNTDKCLSISNDVSSECEHKPNLKVKHLLNTFIDSFFHSQSFHINDFDMPLKPSALLDVVKSLKHYDMRIGKTCQVM